jgi:hypothetical protein
MVYRATPNTTTGYSPFYLLHGREMILPSSDNLKAKIAMDNPNHQQRLESLKESLRTAYEAVGQANKNSHQNNKRLYDRRAKLREFKEGEFVYLFTPAKKPRLSKKFRPKWSGPYKIVKKISELNYEIEGSNDKRQIVHVNRLKAAHDPSIWKPKPRCQTPSKRREKSGTTQEEEEGEEEVRIGPFPLLSEMPLEARTPPDRSSSSLPTTPQPAATSPSEGQDPTYQQPETPRTRRETQNIRTEPPLTRSRTRITSQ